MKNKIFQSRDLCLRALDTNSVCAKSVRRNERRMKEFEVNNENDYLPLRDVLEVCRALDALAVELACERITEDELAELKKACENFELETKRGNANQVAQADVELHDIILKASGNERLMQMISKLSQQMYRYRLEYVKDEANYKRLIAEHRVIYEAIRDRDRQTGAEAIKNHIDNQEKAVIRMITSASGKIKR